MQVPQNDQFVIELINRLNNNNNYYNKKQTNCKTHHSGVNKSQYVISDSTVPVLETKEWGGGEGGGGVCGGGGGGGGEVAEDGGVGGGEAEDITGRVSGCSNRYTATDNSHVHGNGPFSRNIQVRS